MRLRRSPDVVNKRCYSKPNDFRAWHETDIPMQPRHVRCWGINRLGWDAARDLKMTHKRRCPSGRPLCSAELKIPFSVVTHASAIRRALLIYIIAA
jgi:hypothetical protein